MTPDAGNIAAGSGRADPPQGETLAPFANISFVTVATLSAADTAFGVMVTSQHANGARVRGRLTFSSCHCVSVRKRTSLCRSTLTQRALLRIVYSASLQTFTLSVAGGARLLD